MKATRASKVRLLASSRIPTGYGVFRAHVYADRGNGKEHVALVKGDVRGKDNVLVRIHSECFTGDVLGSRRCDCGEQLRRAIGRVAEEKEGIVLYLRQEGRGIGLVGKMRAYNLQDIGFDTVDANLLLGYGADEREYGDAAHILRDLGVSSVRLMTNNPAKIENLRKHGIPVVTRVPLVGTMYPENAPYLAAKAKRMNHLISLDGLPGRRTAFAESDRPSVTLCYAQSIDGCIASVPGEPFRLSGPESLTFVHSLRSAHDAILVGIGTVLSDDPLLTVRRVSGKNPRPVILDTHLRFPPEANLLSRNPLKPWIAAGKDADPARRAMLEKAGARVMALPADPRGGIDLSALLAELAHSGVRKLMVEGGARVITSFLSQDIVDHVVLTVSPVFVGGIPAFAREGTRGVHGMPRLTGIVVRQLGRDVIIEGEPEGQ